MSESVGLEVINFTNIDKEDFEGMYGGVPKVFKKGKTVPMPRFQAIHYAKHLITKMIRAEGGNWGDDIKRGELEKKILGEISVEEDAIIEEVKKEEFADLKKEDKKEVKKEEKKEDKPRSRRK